MTTRPSGWVARFPYRQPDPGSESGRPEPHGGVPPWLQERLFDRRIVMLAGPLTGDAASQTAAALITLDAIGVRPVQLHVTAVDGELSAAFAVVDAIRSMRAPVDVVVPSQAGGASLAVLAAARRRLAFPHARLRLVEPGAALASGTADRVAGAAGEYLRELEELIVALADMTHQRRSRIEDDLSAGRVLTAPEAKEYGLIDDIIDRAQEI
ncbi:MAG TPA: ATP-dependent Clp protease proteolytic subunit [Micromonosporaceae bacterium]|nr:ATP-dependent Clp protease proteolytic subunit [Micromonosporaceae bacterium]